MSRASVRSSKPAWHACRCSRIVRSRRGDDWWWEPGEPDLDVHVREEQPEPGERGFEAVCARLVMQPLPPDRPLWDLVLVPGARPGRCGIVVRFHHLLADGAHAVELIERLSDPGPAEPADAATEPRMPQRRVAARPAPPAHPASPARPPSRLAVLGFRVRQFIRPPIRSRTLLGPLGPRRDVAGASVDFDEVHRRAHEAGGTVGDAVPRRGRQRAAARAGVGRRSGADDVDGVRAGPPRGWRGPAQRGRRHARRRARARPRPAGGDRAHRADDACGEADRPRGRDGHPITGRRTRLRRVRAPPTAHRRRGLERARARGRDS